MYDKDIFACARETGGSGSGQYDMIGASGKGRHLPPALGLNTRSASTHPTLEDRLHLFARCPSTVVALFLMGLCWSNLDIPVR